ncbi:MAG: hypothetical protein NTW19_22780 [Planctomycetota bacterium]|nr:hypothetical protein [Planctomycetota bacterium]
MPFQLKETLDRHPRWVGAGAALVTALAVAWLARGSIAAAVRPEYKPPPAYYYELATGLVFPGPFRPPNLVQGPAGGPSVRAAVFSCGSCDAAESRFPAWLESEELVEGKIATQGPEGEKAWLMAMNWELPTSDEDDLPVHYLVKSVDAREWQVRTDERLAALREMTEAKCEKEGGKATPCLPKAEK